MGSFRLGSGPTAPPIGFSWIDCQNFKISGLRNSRASGLQDVRTSGPQDGPVRFQILANTALRLYLALCTRLSPFEQSRFLDLSFGSFRLGSFPIQFDWSHAPLGPMISLRPLFGVGQIWAQWAWANFCYPIPLAHLCGPKRARASFCYSTHTGPPLWAKPGLG